MKSNFIVFIVFTLFITLGISAQSQAQSWRWYRWGKCGYSLCKDDTAGMSEKGAACTHSCTHDNACGYGCRGSFWPWNWGRGCRMHAGCGHEESCAHEGKEGGHSCAHENKECTHSCAHEGKEAGHSCTHEAKSEGKCCHKGEMSSAHSCSHDEKAGKEGCCHKGEKKECEKCSHHGRSCSKYYYRGGGY